MSNRRKPRQALPAPGHEAGQGLGDLARARRFLGVLADADVSSARIATETSAINREAPWAFGLVLGALWTSLATLLNDDPATASRVAIAALDELTEEIPR